MANTFTVFPLVSIAHSLFSISRVTYIYLIFYPTERLRFKGLAQGPGSDRVVVMVIKPTIFRSAVQHLNLPLPPFLQEKVSIPFGSKELVGALMVPETECVKTALVLTHGAGGDMNLKPLMSLAQAAAASGLLCLRFTCKSLNLVHRVKAYEAAVVYLTTLDRFKLCNMFLGGRSMGARAAVALARHLCVKKEVHVQGLVCVSFPLHPPGQTHAHVKRSEDLMALSHIPVLFVSGTADNMCERQLLERIVEQMESPSSVNWVEGANHGLAVKARAEESVQDEVNSQIITWILKHV